MTNKKVAKRNLGKIALMALASFLGAGVLIFFVWNIVQLLDKSVAEEELWRVGNKQVISENSSCEVLKVAEVIKNYNPKTVELRVLYYGEGSGSNFGSTYKYLEVPNNVDVSFVDNKSNDFQYAKVCFNQEGYVDTINEYNLNGEDKND